MITKEQIALIAFLAKTTQRRPQRNTYVGFLTPEQASAYARENHRLVSHHFTLADGTRHYFYSDNHTYGYLDEQNKINAVPVSFSIPTQVTARAELPTGVITTLKEHQLIFNNDEQLIPTFHALIELLTQHQLYTLDNRIKISW